MKIIVNRSALLEALDLAAKVTAGRTPKPVLKCCLLRTDGDVLLVEATNLEQRVRASTPQVQVESQGEALVPADKLWDIVKTSEDDTLNLECNGGFIHVRGGDSHFKIPSQPTKDFPAAGNTNTEGVETVTFKMPAPMLMTMIGRTEYAVAKETTRYAFNGALLSGQKGKAALEMVATDGKRMALARGTASSALPGDVKTILPIVALKHLLSILKGSNDDVTVTVTDNSASFEVEGATLWTGLVEGAFPPYEDIIPKGSDKVMTAESDGLVSAVKRAALFTSEESKGVVFSLSKKGLVLEAKSPMDGEARVEFPCKYEGADLVIGFNPGFLKEAIGAAAELEVKLHFTAANRPMLLTAGADVESILMPTNLQ